MFVVLVYFKLVAQCWSHAW